MLDKGQISDWEGEPEEPGKVAKPVARVAEDDAAPKGSGEALPTGEFVTLTPEQVSARKRRSVWIALALFAFVILLFVLTMAKVSGGMGVPEVYNLQGSQ